MVTLSDSQILELEQCFERTKQLYIRLLERKEQLIQEKNKLNLMNYTTLTSQNYEELINIRLQQDQENLSNYRHQEKLKLYLH